jgi:hypothetical protein
MRERRAERDWVRVFFRNVRRIRPLELTLTPNHFPAYREIEKEMKNCQE